MPPVSGEETLYDRIGGEKAIGTLMDTFYDRVFADNELRPFFEGVALERLRRMQREFFAAALGGPVVYSGRALSEVHYGRGIRPRHLRLFLDHLLETLRGQEVSEEDAYEVVTRIHIYADDITGTTTVDG